MKFFSLLFIILSLNAYSIDIKYTDATFKASPIEHAMKLDMFFKDEGYIPLAEGAHGIPSLGINQVYTRDDGQFVMVKYGIVGEFPINKWIDTGKGRLIHQKTGGNKFFLYFHNVNEISAKLIVDRMRDKISSYRIPSFKSILIQEAHAQDCAVIGAATVAQMQDFSNLSATMIWNFAKSCATGLGQGAWNSTGGAVVGAVSSIWSAVTHPIDTINSVASSVYNFTIGLGRFVRGIITDPRGTMMRAGRAVGGAWTQMVDAVSSMSTDLKIQFVCNLLASLGVDAAIAFFTAGAAAPRLALSMANMARRFGMIGRILIQISRMGARARALVGFNGDKVKRLMQRVMAGTIDEGDLRHLDDIAQADQNLALGALSCML